MRIVGSGLIATAFRHGARKTTPPLTIFASGVSNSQLNSPSDFSRERTLLEVEILKNNMKLVYFSTMSLEDPYSPQTPYLQHKRALEKLVQESGNLVVRLPLIVGPGGSEHTLLNFFSKKMMKGEDVFAMRDAKRSVLDVTDLVSSLYKLVRRLPDGAPVQRITGPELSPVSELASTLKLALDSTSRIVITDGISEYPTYPENFFCETAPSGTTYENGYARDTIHKYYSAKAS